MGHGPGTDSMSEDSVFQPAAEHEWLTSHVGEWAVKCEYFMSPGEEPIEVDGVESVEMLGPFWAVGRFEADMLGTPVVGESVLGFDPVKRCFTGSWKDSYTPFHYRFEGELSDDRRALDLVGSNYDPMRQREATYRWRTEYVGDGERVMSLSVEVDGSEVPILRYRYVRK